MSGGPVSVSFDDEAVRRELFDARVAALLEDALERWDALLWACRNPEVFMPGCRRDDVRRWLTPHFGGFLDEDAVLAVGRSGDAAAAAAAGDG